MDRHFKSMTIVILASILLLAACAAWAGPVVTVAKVPVKFSGITLPSIPVVTNATLVNPGIQLDTVSLVKNPDLSTIGLESLTIAPKPVEIKPLTLDFFGPGQNSEDRNRRMPIVNLFPPDPPDSGLPARYLCIDLDGDGVDDCI